MYDAPDSPAQTLTTQPIEAVIGSQTQETISHIETTERRLLIIGSAANNVASVTKNLSLLLVITPRSLSTKDSSISLFVYCPLRKLHAENF